MNGFSNNYNGFDTWEEANEAYYNFLLTEYNNHGQLVAQPEQHQPPAVDQEHHLHNAAQNHHVQDGSLKDFIILVLLLVILKLILY